MTPKLTVTVSQVVATLLALGIDLLARHKVPHPSSEPTRYTVDCGSCSPVTVAIPPSSITVNLSFWDLGLLVLINALVTITAVRFYSQGQVSVEKPQAQEVPRSSKEESSSDEEEVVQLKKVVVPTRRSRLSHEAEECSVDQLAKAQLLQVPGRGRRLVIDKDEAAARR
jgi:hypothetical protein